VRQLAGGVAILLALLTAAWGITSGRERSPSAQTKAPPSTRPGGSPAPGGGPPALSLRFRRVGRGMDAAFSPDGKFLAAVDGESVRFLDSRTGKVLASLNDPDAGFEHVTFSPDGKTLASTSGSGEWDGDAWVKLWDTASRKLRVSFKYPKHWVGAPAFSPGGKTVAVGLSPRYYRTEVRLLDPNAGKERVRLAGRMEILRGLAFSSDSRWLAWCGAAEGDDEELRGAIVVWDTVRRRVRFDLRTPSDDINALAFSPDGKTFASGDENGTIRLWETWTGRQRAVLPRRGSSVLALGFHPGGRALASAEDQTVTVLDLPSGTPAATLEGLPGEIWSLAFSPDGKALAACAAGEVMVWDFEERHAGLGGTR
jgi:WD40 repeat protein